MNTCTHTGLHYRLTIDQDRHTCIQHLQACLLSVVERRCTGKSDKFYLIPPYVYTFEVHTCAVYIRVQFNVCTYTIKWTMQIQKQANTIIKIPIFTQCNVHDNTLPVQVWVQVLTLFCHSQEEGLLPLLIHQTMNPILVLLTALSKK